MRTHDHTIATEDGRKIRIIDAGQPDGIPILVLHGTPSAGVLYAPWVKDAESRGIRLISYFRPGYGGSTSQPGRHIASTANDVAVIAQELGLSRICVWGLSMGGSHALACAALLPNLVVAAASLASPAPYQADGLDFFAGMMEDNIAEFGTALKGRDEIEQFVETAAQGMLNATPENVTEGFRSILSPVDVAVLTDDFVGFLLEGIREGNREKRDGWIDDDLAFVLDWVFDLAQIRIPLMLMHGKQDKIVPFSHGKWLTDRISNVDAFLLPDDGHLTLSHRIPVVHTWLLGKM